ncbi:MAG: TPM domain-containing protein [Xanthomonadaceae bacterium]|nr:TPM domain-containing protein [Xanthomonadaceae bacterium]
MAIGELDTSAHRISDAIAQAEAGTSGELRVHISHRLIELNPMKRARKLFTKQELHLTKYRNGVLIYVNPRRKKFAIVGDQGIHTRVGQEYWNQWAAKLQEDLRSTHYENAVCDAIKNIGDTLKKYFPVQEGDENPNELPNIVTED